MMRHTPLTIALLASALLAGAAFAQHAGHSGDKKAARKPPAGLSVGAAFSPAGELWVTGLELALRARSGDHSGSVGIFRQRFKNFLTLFGTGNTRGADGELNPIDADGDGVADGSGEDVVNELVYRAVPAEFRGFEAQTRFRLIDKAGSLDLELKADTVRATDQSNGTPLPRIAPARFGVALDYAWNRLSARLDVNRVKGQNRVSAGELPTDGYTMVNAGVSQRVNFSGGVAEVFLRGVNLTNVEARNHVSFLKDRVPLGGRGLQAGLRATF